MCDLYASLEYMSTSLGPLISTLYEESSDANIKFVTSSKQDDIKGENEAGQW